MILSPLSAIHFCALLETLSTVRRAQLSEVIEDVAHDDQFLPVGRSSQLNGAPRLRFRPIRSVVTAAALQENSTLRAVVTASAH
jgi:hypothetical protein